MTLKNVISELKESPSYLGHLKKYASKSLSEDDIKNKVSKGGKFVFEHFKSIKDGLYLAFHGPDISDKNGKLFSIAEILENLEDIILKCQYSGEGDLLDRIAKMRSGRGAQNAKPVVFWRTDKNINMEDIYVLSFALDLTGKERKNKFESPIHRYCEEHRSDGKRFALADYSSSNGESGTKAQWLENEIKSYQNMSYEVAMMNCAKVSSLLQTTLNVVVAANTAEILAGTNTPNISTSTITQ